MRFISTVVLACAATAALALSFPAHAAVTTITGLTDGPDPDSLGGADTFVVRNSTANNSADGNLAVVNRAAADNNADRVPFLRFDISGMVLPDKTPADVTEATFRITLGANAVPTSFAVQLWGIPDGAANENFNASTITFANSGYTTGTGSPTANDATDNSVLDASLVLLGTFAAPTINTTYTLTTPELAAFLQADTNGIASFVLATTIITSGGTSTPVFNSSDNVAGGDAIPALIVTSVPEPASLALLPLIALTTRRRR